MRPTDTAGLEARGSDVDSSSASSSSANVLVYAEPRPGSVRLLEESSDGMLRLLSDNVVLDRDRSGVRSLFSVAVGKAMMVCREIW